MVAGGLTIIGCGDRNWTDAFSVRMVMGSLFQSFGSMTVIEGVCPYGGADKLIAEWAVQNQKNGVVHRPMPADWNGLGKAAGPERNKAMLSKLVEFDGTKLVVAFHRSLMSSKGTKHMVEIALEAVSRGNIDDVWLFDGQKMRELKP